MRRRVATGISKVVDRRLRSQSMHGGRVVVGRDTLGTSNVQWGGENIVGRNCTFVAKKISVGRRTTINNACHIAGPVTIGAYCSFAPGVAVFGRDHPTRHLTTYVGRALLGGHMKRHAKVAPVQIGNDVYVGHGATILSGVTVGDGAIIAAGAVVTRDVDAYTLVAGNPATAVKQRFRNDVVTALLRLRWWEFEDAQLARLRPLLDLDLEAEPDRALELLRDLTGNGIRDHLDEAAPS